MRTVLYPLLLLLLTLETSAQDRHGLHFGAGFLIGGATASLNSLTPTQSFVWGTGAAALAGFSKEFSDYSRGYRFDQGDLFYSVFGGALSSILVYQIKRHWWPAKGTSKPLFFMKKKKYQRRGLTWRMML